MAGSRLHKIGTIFTRTTGLIKSEAMKPADKPIWYEVYEAFPPKIEPRFDRPIPTNPIRNILYEEDTIRAAFYKKYGSAGLINMFETNSQPSVCELFIQEFLQRRKDTSLSEDELMEEVVAHLQNKGIYVKAKPTKNSDEVSNDSRPFDLYRILADNEELDESLNAIKKSNISKTEGSDEKEN